MGDHAMVYPGDWRRRRGQRPWPVFIGFMQVFIGFVMTRHNLMSPENYLLLLVGPAILLAGYKRWPGWAVLGVNAAALAFYAVQHSVGPVVPSIVASVINAVVLGRRVPAWVSLGGLAAGSVLVDYLSFHGFREPVRIVWVLVWIALLAGLAELVENRRQRAIVYRKLWEEERRRRELQREQQAGEERLKIARELHDVLAHSLSLITVRASVALELMDSNPQEVRQALMAIKQASKSGLDEVRTVLHGIRTDAPRTPAPDLSQLEGLVAQAKTAGLTVRLALTGRHQGIPAACGLAGYRIIQEALTNVIRHSQARTAVVHVHDAGWALLIGVADDGPARPKTADETGDSNGSGLVGIKERAASLGGTAEAEPRQDGGFDVYAALPLPRGTT
jgi:signal transduction histidine kinase